MVNKKRQHFVPRMYLKRFSSDSERQIDMLHLSSGRVFRKTSLRKQCYKNKFHGDDPKVEDFLSMLESEWSKVIRTILYNRAIPGKNTEAYEQLLLFIAFQSLRTKKTADKINQQYDLMAKATFSHYPEAQGLDLNSVTIGYKNPVLIGLQTAPAVAEMLDDLAIRFVTTSEELPFATSDAPVIQYNQSCEGIQGIGVASPASVGVQIFVPLSPVGGVFLYDEQVYKFGYRRGKNGNQLKGRDVYTLNAMQAVFADQNVYFNGNFSDSQIQALIRDSSAHRGVDRFRLSMAEGINNTSESGSSLMIMTHEMPNLNVDFGFLSLKRRQRKISRFERARALRRIAPEWFERFYEEEEPPESDPNNKWKVVNSDWKPGDSVPIPPGTFDGSN